MQSAGASPSALLPSNRYCDGQARARPSSHCGKRSRISFLWHTMEPQNYSLFSAKREFTADCFVIDHLLIGLYAPRQRPNRVGIMISSMTYLRRVCPRFLYRDFANLAIDPVVYFT